jgi:serine/threonine-protein kinase
MSTSVRPSLAALSLEDALCVEGLCTRFETAWQHGERPRAEAYRSEVAPEVWPVLLRELLSLEMNYRLSERDRPTAPEETASIGPAATAAVPMEGVPASFGDYEAVTEVGHGAQAVVCKAWNRKLKRPEALKLLAGPVTPRERERFRFEGEAAAALNHPNIVAVYHVDQVGGRPFLAMKWVEGTTLAVLLREPKGDLRTVVRLLAAAARAVQHAHQRGILHRDLKPANVLIDADGQAHVTDFGLARRLDVPSGTAGGEVAGTPSYMAPEQARGEADLTTAVDVYGLGAILYEGLTGQPPYRGATAHEVLRQVRERDAPPPRALAPDTDGDLEAVCLKCLKRAPAERYRSAEALAEDLERWLNGEPVSARPPGMWEWLRQMWRNKPPPGVTYSWQVLMWIGLLSLAMHGFTYSVVLLNGSSVWLWVAVLVRVGVIGEAERRYRIARFRSLSARERHGLIMGIGLMLIDLTLASIYLPIWSSVPARDVLGFYPPLAVTCGLALFITGSTYWGRLLPVGLAMIALAPVLAAWPEWSPLLFGILSGGSMLWWSYCTKTYFGPQPSAVSPPDRETSR